jgi:hypothetical protein
MSLLKALYISAFLFFNSDHDSLPQFGSCDDLKLSASVTYVENTKGKIEIKAEGGVSPYTYIFYKTSGHLVSAKYSSNVVDGLEKGKYACTVADKNNCKKTIEIEIK